MFLIFQVEFEHCILAQDLIQSCRQVSSHCFIQIRDERSVINERVHGTGLIQQYHTSRNVNYCNPCFRLNSLRLDL